MMEEKKKRSIVPVIALIALLAVGLIGATLAVFRSTDSFANIFQTKTYKTEVTEVFESPDDWTPGTTTSKTVTAKNTGDVDVAVRVFYTESWVDANGQTLPLQKDGVSAAIINFADDYATKWTESTENGVKYIYYKTKLATGESTTSFIESVTFNEAVNNFEGEKTTNCTEPDATGTKTCTTTYSGYNGGTYTLTITVDTVQYDQYETVWNTEVEIS